MTLVELVVAIAIMAILATGVLPITRTVVKREREKELRAALWEMRDAIDRYKDAADRGAFQIKLGSEGYPPDLDDAGERRGRPGQEDQVSAPHSRGPDDPQHGVGTCVRCRTIPRRTPGAGKRCLTYTRNRTGTALDGTKYSDW